MTMLLSEAVIVRVQRVAGKKNWFVIDAVPKMLGYGDIGEWLADEVSDDLSRIVQGAKLMGIHDDEEIPRDDPRFNSRANIAGADPEFCNEPDFVVVKQPKGERDCPKDLYLCAMLINRPESVFFEYSAKAVYGAAFTWQGLYDEWTRISESHVADIAKTEETV